MIKTEQGDICLPKCVAVVNPSNKIASPIGKIIEKYVDYGGPSIAQEMQEQIKTLIKPKIGDVYVTKAGRLYRRGVTYIYHGVFVEYPGGLISPYAVSITLNNILNKAVNDKIESIAIPSFESSNSKFNKLIFANTMIQVAKKFEKLIEIKFIDENPDFVDALNSYLKVSIN